MKSALHIFLLCGAAMWTCAIAEAQEADACEQFRSLVADQNYLAARGLMTNGETDTCTSSLYLHDAATVLAAFGDYASAMVIAAALVQKHPDEPMYTNLNKRIIFLLNQPHPRYSAELKRVETGNPDASETVALIEGEVPVILTQRSEDTVYFPAVRPGRKYYALADYHPPTDTSVFAERLGKFMPSRLGPGAVLPDSILVFTAVYEKNLSFRRPKLRLYALDPNQPRSRPEQLPFCQRGFNYFHPAFDADEGTLVFGSDAPGGSGGADLWRTEYKEGTWGEPENVGPSVNTSHNETFPFVSGDSLLFSSDRPDAGFGGVDVYLHTRGEVAAANIGMPVNSPYDDFGLQKAPGGRYYFSSDRPGRLPGCNVFTFIAEPEELFFTQLRGRIAGLDNPAGVPLHLMSVKGDTLQTVLLMAEGAFTFNDVRGLRGYKVALNGNPPGDDLLVMQFLDEENKVYKEVETERGESFSFQLLTPEDYFLGRMNEEDTSILDISITGQYLSGNNDEPEGVRIVLQDAQGETVGEAYTEQDGMFKFESIRPDDTYTITADGVSSEDVIHVIDGSGRIIQTIVPDADGGFVYVRLSPDVKSVTLTNERSQQVRVEAGTEIELPEVHFGLNKSTLTERGLLSLQKLLSLMEKNPDIRVELAGHTDSRGTADYNLRLSHDRIATVLRYLTAHGIERSRISGKGYGESRLRNRCADGVDCTEEEHAVNRRTEFKIYEIKN